MTDGLEIQGAIAALSDPTRRALIDKLRKGPQSVGCLSDGLPVSRPAVSQHLKVLGEAGIVQVTRNGTRNFYHLCPEGLETVRLWLDALWDDALQNFQDGLPQSSSQEDAT